MSLYAVKNDKGEWLEYDGPVKADWNASNGTLWTKQNKPYAESSAKRMRGRVVKLVEKSAPIVVSEEDAEILRGLDKVRFPASEISRQSKTASQQDRLMRAYVLGWEVEKPKRYVLPMEGTDQEDDGKRIIKYAYLGSDGAWDDCYFNSKTEAYTVTQADLDDAPGWVKAIAPVEVPDHD